LVTARGAAAPAEPAADGPGLIGSYQTFDRLVATLGPGTASIEDLLAGPPAAPAATAAPGAHAGDIVPITALLYSAESATERLIRLRDTVRGMLAGNSPDRAALQDLIDEVFDLVELGAGGRR
jgi:hypothetical protein